MLGLKQTVFAAAAASRWCVYRSRQPRPPDPCSSSHGH